ncbi:hypothetical protein E2C01_066429 [Portunus trituberculatus]|uniref:Uncharacterized protein n=1 Tax=Portunus trituberculatus TaxID=210409 RepID=A0A5B7HR08_PORTR|nr:hypothetical protein [Portunus trituberculatus]
MEAGEAGRGARAERQGVRGGYSALSWYFCGRGPIFPLTPSSYLFSPLPVSKPSSLLIFQPPPASPPTTTPALPSPRCSKERQMLLVCHSVTGSEARRRSHLSSEPFSLFWTR